MQKIILRLPALITMGISWYLSSGTLENVQMPSVSDKLIHLVCFAGLGFFWTWWFKKENWLQKPLKQILYVTLIVAAYGLVDEIHQYFVPGRSCQFTDILIDSSGALCGVLFLFVIVWLYNRRKSQKAK